MDTPPFLLWSLEYTCQVRGFETGCEPERVERLLRAARAASEAIVEGRVLEGVCVSPPYGFRLADALAIYGGQETVETCCTGCPANAVSRNRPGTWAGCFGLVPLPLNDEFETRLAAALAHESVSHDIARLFATTKPVWHGLWLRSPLTAEQAQVLAALIKVAGLAQLSTDFADLEAALNAAAAEKLPLHVVQYPPGRVVTGWWRLATHCSRCKAVWSDRESRRCGVCDYMGPPAPDTKRRARGRRPYVLLERLMGAVAAAEFLNRHEVFRAQHAPLDRAQNPLQPKPPGNLQAD